ncbi:UdgX family uracil-DNA binding protein [Jannaschia aquimarina]|uniref:Type-4 uracil-DNA glycosylase n=1 Tax=Jannaschia aquimarina TaxID=935700 RepID=A0A0D1DBY6_9RHOB|nr:UdgX family uracil-DNA binding protein [Jannaschia aquimarina]KIT17523.1 Uracil DNA glycosylase superfamily protein [Jannaschia aquimarina]SNS73788.1 DNA polymerase [Jannaschia aquimarina]
MFAPRLPRLGTFDAWRDAARRLAAAGIPPSDVEWGLETDPAPLIADPLPAGDMLSVPKAFPALARHLIPYRSNGGMALAYTLLTRLKRHPRLLSDPADPDVARANEIAKSVRRDIHKMHAFLRFREVEGDGRRRRFSAWFEPDHRIEENVGRFFADRFGDMDWEIATPDVKISFEAGRLSYSLHEGGRPAEGDPLEELWTTYYKSIFNPARLKPKAMSAEMPKKYWRNLPEAQAIPDLIAGARARVSQMVTNAPRPARALTPSQEAQMNSQTDLFAASGLPELAKSASACTRCPLYSDATQIVFGEGPEDARVMIVGEQPGDKEDIAGRPFVGPAGQMFDEQAIAAGLDRSELYVTNAVKHFKFVQRGRRRIHQKPAASEVSACRWWLEQELTAVDPDLCVALGATALHALTGNGAGLLKRRGGVEKTRDGRPVLITVHPSYLLRLPGEEDRARETERFRDDLSRIPELLKDMAA